jgi:putative SOS response-associated peptidase YedK
MASQLYDDESVSRMSCSLLRCTPACLILPEEHHAKWLGEAQDGDLKKLLKPFSAERMKMRPISSRVNDPKNDDEDIITPVAG